MPNNLPEFLATKAALLTRYVERDAPRIIAKMARDHARQSFHEEGFTDDSYTKWKELKIKKEGRKILSKTGDLKNSLRTEIIRGNNDVLIEVGSDLDYAKIHNEGGTMIVSEKQRRFFWRQSYKDTPNKDFWKGLALAKQIKIPKRQFLGHSKVLDDNIQAKLNADVDNILNSI